MADTPETEKLVKKEPDAPPADPITRRSTASILLISALLLTGSLAWALWDEVYGQRPWKTMQTSFVKRYNRYLQRLKRGGFASEEQVRESEEFQRLDAAAKAAEVEAQPHLRQLDRRVSLIDKQLDAITNEFQDRRGRITVLNYSIEVSEPDDKNELREEVRELKERRTEVEWPQEDGGTVERNLNFDEIEADYNRLKSEKAELQAQRGELLKPVAELKRERDEYLRNNVAGVTEDQVNKLLAKNDDFEVKIRQINVQGDLIVDRCETCHLGIREPIEITAGDMMSNRRRDEPDELARAFVSHPNKELLQIHDPERFGCSSCHGGNGRATTSIVKGHGRHRFWLHPMYARENMEAGCQQCHSQDRVLVGADILNKGKDLYAERGCVGCHRYEGFDRETDALMNARQEIKQLNEQIASNEREVLSAREKSAQDGLSDEESQRLLSRMESLRVNNSQLESRIDQLNIQARYLMQDQKKVGPNLKDAKMKLVKEWIPVWLQDPQAFRPGTKMPTYWYLSGEEKNVHGNLVPVDRQIEERNAIAAYIWQNAYDVKLPKQPLGDPARGEQLFNMRGCLACHSIDRGGENVGGEFAANLTRVGEKAHYDYLVRWVHNPRQRVAPYCPTHERDLTADDYAHVFEDRRRRGLITQTQYESRDLTSVFGPNNSKCPKDGAELQIQNMTVMPNFRLSDQESRDIATYLKSLSSQASFPNASFMDDRQLAAKGKELIKQYGCAGCHEIKGFEQEQRIGKELTTEGATPIERLDFALMTHEAEDGHDPLGISEGKSWYNHKGFIEHKIQEPSIYDKGKEKEPADHLRMPKPYLKDESWRIALTTFLLGSKGVEGANVPSSFFYNPNSQQKDIQEGWWVIKKYNCTGCHQVQVGQERPVITTLPWYREEGELGKNHWPPGLLTEGARVDPNWLLRFLTDPSLSGVSEDDLQSAVQDVLGGRNGANLSAMSGGRRADPFVSSGAPMPPPSARNASARTSSNGEGASQPLPPQPGLNRNGLRNIEVRMPTFHFSPNELRILVRFFMAYAAQQEPYIKERVEPLSAEEVSVARALFTSDAAPCLKCHLTGNPEHDRTAYAPNFLDSAQRLKPDWTYRWIIDPRKIWPDTTMPDGLFEMKDGRWVLRGMLPEAVAAYQGDHAKLLVRYMLQLNQQEQNALAQLYLNSQRQPQAAPAAPPPASAHNWTSPPAVASPKARDQRASHGRTKRGRRREVSYGFPKAKRSPKARGQPAARAPSVAAHVRGRAGGFPP